MGTIAIPSNGPRDWQRVLADPDLHWKPGASAMTLAACWEAAQGGFPPEVRALLDASGLSALVDSRPLLIIPEFEVALPGGRRASQTDVFVLASGAEGLVTVAVEGKVDEPFGPTVAEKRRDASPGQIERLHFLQEKLGLTDVPGEIRYQLLHRTVSALLLAEDFGAVRAVILVHSFSSTARWFDDFRRFGELLGVSVQKDGLVAVPAQASPDSLAASAETSGGRSCPLYIGWCSGDRSFAEVDLRAPAGASSTHG